MKRAAEMNQAKLQASTVDHVRITEDDLDMIPTRDKPSHESSVKKSSSKGKPYKGSKLSN